MHSAALPGNSGRDSERAIWLKMSASVSSPADEEGSGAEAGGRHGHDPQ